MSSRPWVRWLLSGLVLLAAGAALWLGHLRHRAEQAHREPAGPLLADTVAEVAHGAGGAAPAGAHTGGDGGPAPAGTAPAGTAPAGTAAVPEPPALWVHVAGAVARPGVYRLPDGARVADAVTAAGGPGPEGVSDALNLAARLADGDKVYVPTLAELDAAGSPAPARQGANHAPAGTGAAAGSRGPISINRAGPAELEAVPGIGPSLAQRIVEHRRQRGPFERLEQLLDVPGIGDKKLEQMRGHITL